MAMLGSTACDLPRYLPWRRTDDRWPHSRTLAIGSSLVAVVVLLAAASWSTAALDHHRGAESDPAELIYVPSTRFLRVVSLGYEQVLADVLWFRAISYFGWHYRGNRIYPWLASMCDVVTDLDPRAEHVYHFCGVILPWEADRIDDGIALLEKGARNMPDSWQLHYMLGFSYYFFRDDLDSASRTLRQATFLPGAPEFISRLAVIVEAAHHGPASAVDFLTELERHDVSGDMREVIHQRIRELSLADDISSLDAAVRTFERRAGRSPTDLSELLSAGVLTQVPQEPFGGRYEFDHASGHVVSTSGHKPTRLGSSQLREAFLKARRSGH